MLVDGGRPIADFPPWGFGYFAIHTESCMVAELRVLLPKGSIVVVLEERGAGWARRGADRFPFLSILTLCKPGPPGPSGR